jgi:hypothetical protein
MLKLTYGKYVKFTQIQQLHTFCLIVYNHMFY